jgi:NAD(P)-dependent dehydrogenase (short-subunit alcohol dehydrogenase family)
VAHSTRAAGPIPRRNFSPRGVNWTRLLVLTKSCPPIYKGSGKLVGRKALLTGADSGIGRAVAIAFAREGADVVIVRLPSEAEDAEEVIKTIEADGRKALSVPSDIANEAFCEEVVGRSVEEPGGLDKQAGKPTLDRRNHQRAIRPDFEDQSLRHVLDHPGSAKAPYSRLGDYQHSVNPSCRTLRRAAGLRRDQSRHCCVHQGALQAADQ